MSQMMCARKSRTRRITFNRHANLRCAVLVIKLVSKAIRNLFAETNKIYRGVHHSNCQITNGWLEIFIDSNEVC